MNKGSSGLRPERQSGLSRVIQAGQNRSHQEELVPPLLPVVGCTCLTLGERQSKRKEHMWMHPCKNNVSTWMRNLPYDLQYYWHPCELYHELIMELIMEMSPCSQSLPHTKMPKCKPWEFLRSRSWLYAVPNHSRSFPEFSSKFSFPHFLTVCMCQVTLSYAPLTKFLVA